MERKNILIVDDSPANLKLLGLLLGAEGLSVRTAEGATEALQLLSSFTPDVILMDIQMPGVNGLQLTRIIKADPHTKDVMVVAVSANAMKLNIDEAYAAGCEGYITKPINTRTFVSTVRSFLQQGEGASPSVADVKETPAEVAKSLTAACGEQIGLLLTSLGASSRPAVSEVLHRCAGVARSVGNSLITEMSGELETRSGGLTAEELAIELSKLRQRFAEVSEREWALSAAAPGSISARQG